MLVPPENYSMVEEGIYRCCKLDAINISFLKSLELKSIVWINEEKPPRLLKQFIEEHSIKLFHMINPSILPEEDEIMNTKNQEWMVLKPEIISKSIENILDINNQNCLIMDKRDIIVGIIRHIQMWNYTSLSNEYRLYASRTTYKTEIFLEMITLELIPHRDDMLADKRGSSGDDLNNGTDESTEENHSSISAISIHKEGVSSVPPVVRRLSIDNRFDETVPLNNVSPTGLLPTILQGEENQLSSSYNQQRLSISTSPQIPKNLLKMVEQRKHRRKHEEAETAVGEDKGPTISAANTATVTATATATSTLTPTTAAASAPAAATASTASAASNGTCCKTTCSPSAGIPRKWKLYRAKNSGVQVARGSQRGGTFDTVLRVQLPREQNLPRWFVALRAICEECE